MQTEDIDKLVESIDDILVVTEDVKEAKESGDKVTLMEGGVLALKHSGKVIRFIGNLPEIGREVVDLDGEETSEIAATLIAYFGGSPEAAEAVSDVATGAGLMNQGIQKLIEIKKTKV